MEYRQNMQTKENSRETDYITDNQRSAGKYQVLKKYFGYEGFRPGQEELIDAILGGQDALGIMPTGAGKSICYQVPALLLPGITLVISPLISLMMDQVKALNQAGIHAAYINSSLTEGQISKALQYAREGRYKIIYVAPERLETDSFLYFAIHSQISMVTVDEAHCISQWGQDFRPSYLKIVRFIETLPKRPIVSAFTATATELVKEDILCVLGLKNPRTLVTGFDRQNLYFEVRRVKKKDSEVLDYVTRHSGESGIIYCATRKNVDNLCTFLEEMGIDVTRYHAGLSSEERKRNQEDFIYDVRPVMVATNAFGMGIDKSNVRYVIHYNMPQSLENYYQEAGRAGRDGEASECIILYSPQDVMINQFLIDNKGENQEFTWEELQTLKENDQARLRAMTGYCTTKKCLREYILNYFGEYNSRRGEGSSCSNCSNCLTEYQEEDVTELAVNIIRCVQECGQRYGINVITGVLRGENTAKLRSYRLTELSSFGQCKGMKETRLKDIANEMLAEEILRVTQDKYMLVKLGSGAGALLNGERRLLIKCLPESQTEVAESTSGGKKSKARQRMSDILTSQGLELFDRLREKRLELARKEAVPPYIVFSDKTLMDMCIKVPFSRREMLGVTGVGENKYEKYGEQFIQVIKEYCGGEQRMFYYPKENESIPVMESAYQQRNGKEKKGIAKENQDAILGEVMSPGMTAEIQGRRAGTKRGKQEFVLTEEIAGKLCFAEKMTLSDLVGQMNDLRDDATTKRLTNKAIMDKLTEEGYVEEQYLDGMWYKRIKEKGQALGICTERRISQKGLEYDVLLYSEAAQRAIVEKLLGEWKYLMTETEWEKAAGKARTKVEELLSEKRIPTEGNKNQTEGNRNLAEGNRNLTEENRKLVAKSGNMTALGGRNKGKRLNKYVENYVVFDLETTGISTQKDSIIEISAIKVRGGRIVEEYSTLVNPHRHIPAAATAVNGITDKMVADAPDIREALKGFLEFIQDDILVGHNIHAFDTNFVYDAALLHFGVELRNDYVDTLYLARYCLPQLAHHTLGAVSEYFHISTEGAHRALNDCRMNQRCYEELGKRV